MCILKFLFAQGRFSLRTDFFTYVGTFFGRKDIFIYVGNFCLRR
jgi:hypothetical protein